MKVLLVDDEPGIREGLAAVLRRRGHEIRTAADLEQAFAWVDAEEFDLVVTDWRLPDGDAGGLIERCPGPVVAVSGHPDEVTAVPNLREVLQKPVMPKDLLAVMERVAGNAGSLARAQREGVGATRPTMVDLLPEDAAALVRAAVAILDTGSFDVGDDGTFVTLRAEAPVPVERTLADLEALGGDLRVLAPAGTPVVELRFYRDGRPEGPVATVAADGPWPEAGDLAVDLSRGHELRPDAFLALLDRVARRHPTGGVFLLNVPPHLRLFAEVSGRGGELPKRTRVGPRLPEVLTQLWSQA